MFTMKATLVNSSRACQTVEARSRADKKFPAIVFDKTGYHAYFSSDRERICSDHCSLHEQGHLRREGADGVNVAEESLALSLSLISSVPLQDVRGRR